MRVLLVAAFAFAIGTAVGSRWSVYHSTLAAKLTDLLAQTPGKCADVFAGFPLSPVYQVDELQPGKHPIPGLVHATLHGYRQHGMRTFEVFQQTFAPGAATPIHEHACNEVFLVMRGEGTAFIRDKDGKVVQVPVRTNSTFNILPGARHQLVNTGAEDFQALVVTDNPPFQPVIFKSWDDTSAGTTMNPMFWDMQCPDYVPASLKHLVLERDGASAGSTEL